MIVDTSALVSIALEEPGHDRLLRVLKDEGGAGIGAPTLVETGLVLVLRLGPRRQALVGRFFAEAGIEVIPFGEDHWSVAVEAFGRFGKGRHPARLNFGDCLTYAVARLADEPLLCLGGDFAQTDLTLA
ncbi:MAG: type II toxin-antitoxin system VapC family toxin [Gaiellaceae bacterium]